MTASGFLLKQERFRKILFAYGIFISLLIPLTLYIGMKKVIFVLFAPLLLIVILQDLTRYFKIILLVSMFVGFYLYLPARIQVINLFSYVLICYYLINLYRKEFDGRHSLPFMVKLSSTLLIFAVLLSAVNSPYTSMQSLYYAIMFLIYIFTGYVIYKSIITLNDISEYLKYYTYVVAFYGVIIIVSIFASGYLRARGVTGTSFSDIIVCALLTVIFKDFVFEKYKYIHLFLVSLLTIILVTDQSRFAWVGFVISLAYGLLIVVIHYKSSSIRRKLFYFLLLILFGIVLVFVTGLYKIILVRWSNVSFSILQQSEQKEMIGNSLDTRGLIWLTALSTFLNNKLTGVGYFMFQKVSAHYNILPDFLYNQYVMGLDAHSTLMNMLCETGIIGFLCMSLLYITIFALSYRSIKLSRTVPDLSRSIVLNILIFYIESTSVYSGAFTFGYNAYFLYFIFALTIANYVILREKNWLSDAKKVRI